MAYESSIPFADIRDFREAEINGISALFTMCRLDSETLPADFHSCEVMGGRGSDFQWLVPLALANFTGTFVSRQPLLRYGGQSGFAASTNRLSQDHLLQYL